MKRQWIPRDTVARVKRLDLLAYLERYDPHELVRVSRDVYATRTHDSLKISNGKWCWWSQGIGGRSALDYLIKVRGMGFQEAVLHLMDCMGQMPELAPPRSQPLDRKTPLPFRLPPRNQDNRRILAYLTGRGIALPLLQACIRAGMLLRISATTACSWVLTKRASPAMASSAAAPLIPPSCGMWTGVTSGIPSALQQNHRRILCTYMRAQLICYLISR